MIVLDEPTSFLDIRHKLELLSILKKMVLENDLAVIMSLHELDLAQKILQMPISMSFTALQAAATMPTSGVWSFRLPWGNRRFS